VTSVQQAIESLKQSDRSVTIEAIRQIVHRSDVTLRANPHVDLILEQVIINQHLARQRQSIQREEELVQAIQAAVTQLEAQDKSISQQAIAQIVGLSLSALNEYPRIKELLKNLSQQRAVFQQKRRRQREQQLVTQVQTAIRELELLNQPLSLGNIARQVGRSLTSLQCYPQVKEILEQVKVDYQQARIAQAQERDKELAKATRQAAETLTQLGQPITKRAISQLVGLSLPSYRSYPRAIEVLNQVVQQ
jgi:tetratricopeptide (TPR) repeat protein